MKVNAEFLKKVMNCGDENTEISFEMEDIVTKYFGKQLLLGRHSCSDIDISKILIEPSDEIEGKVTSITIRLNAFIPCDERKIIDEVWKDFVKCEYRMLYGIKEDNQ